MKKSDKYIRYNWWITGFMYSTDLVWLTIQCPELGYPKSLPFMRVEQLSADRLLTKIVGVPQTYEEFVIDQTYYWTRSRKTFLWSGCLQTKCFVTWNGNFQSKNVSSALKTKMICVVLGQKTKDITQFGRVKTYRNN